MNASAPTPQAVEEHLAPCRICAAAGPHAVIRTREMLHGTREPFAYYACSNCGCLQITEIPADLSRFYPDAYYSFRPRHSLASNKLRPVLDAQRVRHVLRGGNWIGRVLNSFAKPLGYLDWVRLAGLDANARVLDVGTGAGQLPLRMAHGGFKAPVGIDPFIDETIRYPNGVVIHRTEAADFARDHAGQFDLVMSHHSFEHVPDPHSSMSALERLLAPGGCVLIRIPLADSLAYERYSGDWVQLDPPRHLYLHTRESMAYLAERAGLRVERVVHDSTAYQFKGSELYKRDIAANAPEKDRDIFDAATLAGFASESEAANRDGRGDQAAFYLRRKS